MTGPRRGRPALTTAARPRERPGLGVALGVVFELGQGALHRPDPEQQAKPFQLKILRHPLRNFPAACNRALVGGGAWPAPAHPKRHAPRGPPMAALWPAAVRSPWRSRHNRCAKRGGPLGDQPPQQRLQKAHLPAVGLQRSRIGQQRRRGRRITPRRRRQGEQPSQSLLRAVLQLIGEALHPGHAPTIPPWPRGADKGAYAAPCLRNQASILSQPSWAAAGS